MYLLYSQRKLPISPKAIKEIPNHHNLECKKPDPGPSDLSKSSSVSADVGLEIKLELTRLLDLDRLGKEPLDSELDLFNPP